MTDNISANTQSTEPKYGTTNIDPDSVTHDDRSHASLSFQTVKDDPEIQEMIGSANRNLGVLGFTEHGFRHVGLVANIARNIMARLSYDQRHQELAAIAGYTHDIGNVISRHGHASTGAILAHQILTRMGMEPADVIVVMSAIGSHGDDAGKLGEPVHPVSAALSTLR